MQSLTAPSIAGDAGWYDIGTKVAASFNYVWNETQSSRMNILGISVDGVAAKLSRAGTGTFQESIAMDRAHVLSVSPVTQYRLTVSGGSAVQEAPPSPTADAFYDASSSVLISSARIWNPAPLTREALVSYSLDGGSNQTLDIPYNDPGSFSTPSITFDGPHQVTFGSATQYLVALRFTDATGFKEIAPDSLEIGASHSNSSVEVQGGKVWLDADASYVVKQLLWENADVKPLNQVVSVSAPQNVTIAARVYDATLKVSDYLSIPISGATANIKLANGTSLTRATGGDGTVSLGSIPLGRFNATISYLGTSQAIAADTSQGSQVDSRFAASLPDVGVSVGVVALAVLGAYAVLRRRRAI